MIVAGFAFHFGGIAQVTPNPELSGLYWEWYPLDQSVDVSVARFWGVVALRGWALSGEAATSGAFLLFLSHLSLVGAAAMIPLASVPRQLRGTTALALGLFTERLTATRLFGLASVGLVRLARARPLALLLLSGWAMFFTSSVVKAAGVERYGL